MWVRNRWLKRISDAKKWSRFFQEHSDCTHYHKYHKVVRACCTNPLLNLPAYTLMVSLYQYNFIICKEFHLKHHFGALTKHFHDHYSCTVKKYHGVKKIGIDDRVHTKKTKNKKTQKVYTGSIQNKLYSTTRTYLQKGRVIHHDTAFVSCLSDESWLY